MIFVFYILAALLVFFSWKSLRGGFEYRDYFRRRLSAPLTDFTPFVSVIAPCRGLDHGLEVNLSALFEQDFPAYEIVFVVDSETDESVAVIQKVRDQYGKMRSSLVVAGSAGGESQKVHNLRAAVKEVSDESRAFVFVDSDARPDPNWLKNLVAPLADEKLGAATGYRWFISEEFSLAAEVRAVWNASIASALGSNRKSNFCWGGSTAIRSETFVKLAIGERWRGTLSDDFALTRALNDAGLEIDFVPQALTPSVENCSFRECLEFTTRQMKITRVYAPHLWKLSLFGSGLFTVVWCWGLLNLFLFARGTPEFWISVAVLLLVSAFSIGKSEVRRRTVATVLTRHRNAVRKQFLTQNLFWLLTPPLFLYNGLAALFSRTIVWRGVRYRLDSPTKTTVFR